MKLLEKELSRHGTRVEFSRDQPPITAGNGRLPAVGPAICRNCWRWNQRLSLRFFQR